VIYNEFLELLAEDTLNFTVGTVSENNAKRHALEDSMISNYSIIHTHTALLLM